MKKLFCAAIIILLAISFASVSCAAEDFYKGPAEKAGRGLKNLLLGWTDIPLSIYNVTNDTKNAALGLSVGAWDGFKKAFPRTISGAVDVATFFIPDYSKSPVSPDPLTESSKATK